MGDPKRQRKQYATPQRPWDKDRIDEEAILTGDYGLKSKKEVWRTETLLRDFRREARKLMAASGAQADKESRQLLDKLHTMGLVDEDSEIVDVLSLDIEDLLDRRLQSIVYNKDLANTPKQARQMIVHGHINIGDREVKEPGYLVPVEEEEEVAYQSSSPFAEATGVKGEGAPDSAEAVEEG